MKKFWTVLLVAILVHAYVSASEVDATPVTDRIHPNVFEMVTSWDSDIEEPVVTEVNLDAVAKNRNQFDFAKVKRNGEWIECVGEDDQGFRRYRNMKDPRPLGQIGSNKKRLVVEFQRSAGGTLTTRTMIEFVIETRQVRKSGKTLPIQVLRVISIEAI